MNPLEPMMMASCGQIIWGANDCCMAVSDTYQSLLGLDLMARWRGRYTTRRGAIRIVRKDGHKAIEEAIVATAEELGFSEVDRPADFDLGLVQIRDDVSGEDMICPAIYLDRWWNMRGPHGFLSVDHVAQKVMRCPQQ